MNEHQMRCYQCEAGVNYLFPDGRCGKCTRLTSEEVGGKCMDGGDCGVGGYCDPCPLSQPPELKTKREEFDDENEPG